MGRRTFTEKEEMNLSFDDATMKDVGVPPSSFALLIGRQESMYIRRDTNEIP